MSIDNNVNIESSTYHFIEFHFQSLYSPLTNPNKNYKLALFHNIQKIDETEVIPLAIKQITLVKNKISEPLMLKVPVQNPKGKQSEYFVVLFNVVYPANDKDPNVEEEIGCLKIPVEAMVQLYKDVGEDQRKVYKDWLSPQLQLSYMVTVHINYTRYTQLVKKRSFRESLPPAIHRKSQDQIQVGLRRPLSAVVPSPQQIPEAPRLSFTQDRIMQEPQPAEQQTSTIVEQELKVLEVESCHEEQNQYMNEVTEEVPEVVSERFVSLPVIDQNQEITDKIQQIRMVIKKVPPHKWALVFLGMLVLILISDVVFPAKNKKSNKSKRKLI